MNALPGQLELMTVIDHSQRMGIISMITNDGAQNLEDVIDPQSPQYKWLMEDTHKPAGVRLAKMLSQYDDSPSSQLWSDIQRLAREILKA
jgi:hypothetical protein